MASTHHLQAYWAWPLQRQAEVPGKRWFFCSSNVQRARGPVLWSKAKEALSVLSLPSKDMEYLL